LCTAMLNALHGQTVERFFNHANTFVSLARENGNDQYYLNFALRYLDSCDRIAHTDPKTAKQLKGLRNEIEIAKSTSENNLNYQIEFYQLFTTNPIHYGFANDPMEYAFGNAFQKLLQVTNPEMGNKDIASLNSYSLIQQDNCDDEITEVNFQYLWSNTKHVLIPKSQFRLSKNFHKQLTSSDTQQLNALCNNYKTNSIGLFETHVIDEVDGIVYVSVSYFPYYKGRGFGSTLYTEGFGEDKRGGLLPIVIFLLISSVFYISVLAVCEELYDRIIKKLWHQISFKEILGLFKNKFLLVGASQVLPTLLSFIIVNSVKSIAPDLGTHYLETESLLWVVFITLSMSIIPTFINVFVINRLDIDGFHTSRGYQNFANASIYGSYFSFFYFYSLKYGSIAHEQHFLLILVTFIVGLILGKALYLYLNKKDIKSLYNTGIVGFVIVSILLVGVNLIVLKRFETSGFLQALMVTLVVTIGYTFFEKRKQIVAKKLHDISLTNLAQRNFSYIPEVVNQSKLDFILNKLTVELSESKLNIVVLSGPSGIGKTSFINECLFYRLKAIDRKLLYGDCNEIQEENEIHFEPFVQALASEIGIKNFVNSREQISSKTSMLQPFLESSPIALDSFLDSNYTNASKTLKEHCYMVALELEKRQFKGVLVIEDVQWIDAESREFLINLLKIISNKSQFKQLKTNLSILLTVRESSSNELLRGIVNIDELKVDLGAQVSNIQFENIKHDELFDYINFVELISDKDDIFNLAESSKFILNNLINQKIVTGKANDDFVEANITPHYIYKLLTRMLEDKTLIPGSGGLIFTRQITEEDLPNNDEVDKFYHAIFDRIDSTPTVDRIQWIRILESAAMIGQKFDAAILASVWGIDLLHLLDFLERMEKLGILIDVNQEDNFYQFSSNKVTSALKSYFGSSNAEVKQIILEYNKRWINVQNKEISSLSNFDLDKLSALYRRLKIVKHIEGFDSTYELVYTIYVIRILELEDYDKLNVILKNDNSDLTKYLRGIAKYFETESVLSGPDTEFLLDSLQSSSLIYGNFESHTTRWYLKHYIMIILGKISEAECLQFIDECKNAKETIFVELMVKMILNSESLIQKNGMELLDKFNADVEFRTRKEPILEILFRFLSIKILTNPYCEISKTRDEIEYQFGELKFKLGRQSGFFLWAIYFELKLSYYQFEEDEASQLLVFKEAMKFLNGKNGSKYWATFLLKNHPDHILRNPEFDFKSVMEDVELFLQKRGWLDEVSELTVKMYLLKIQYYIANELWPEAENTISEAKAQMPNDSKNQSYLKFTIDLLQKEESLQYNTGKIESALQACTQAIDLCRLINLKHRLVDMLIDRNIANRKMGKLNKALEDVKMAMQTIREIGNLAPSKIGVSIFQYGQILKEAGNYEEAMKQYLECQQYWPNNSKGEYRKMITEMNMVYCIFHGNLNASLYFEISMSEKRDHIIDYFKKSENEIQLSPVNRKNLMGLGALKFT
jgi:hypothetical protein